MKKTGVKVSISDMQKLIALSNNIWSPGQVMVTFSTGEYIGKNKEPTDIKKVCHRLALGYELPEIPGYYGIDNDNEFVTA